MPKKPEPSDRLCSTCKHWKRDDGDDAGECHRYPPTVLYDVESGAFMVWAATDGENSCGEHAFLTN